VLTRRARRAAIIASLCGVVAALLVPAGVARASSEALTRTRWSSGVGDEAALANPSCDPETGRLRYASRYRPPCVLEWSTGKANGGATTSGVTANTTWSTRSSSRPVSTTRRNAPTRRR
jgi:hypothetical protein